MSKERIILVTNDDGIFAPGLEVLVNIAKEFGTVIVVAPDSPQSGQGHALTIEHPLRLEDDHHFGEVEAYRCSGTPVDCVKLAKAVILKDRKADICLSGINHGSNASINIIYSGTMSAAMEASLEGIDSIGFSFLDYSHEANFDGAIPYVRKLISDALEHGLGETKLLNVNIPNLPANEIKGFKICRQANANWVENFLVQEDPRGRKVYWLTGQFVNPDPGTDTDIWALKNGYVSIVPSKHDLTNYKAIDSLKHLEM
ncbi:MAG: 5'/3'-nucleotidase SurE [Bacteroidota bacterium]